jgi:hypothetical protein
VTDAPLPIGGGDPLDIGEYCRHVEEHLTRVNGGHLVRVVGPGFEIVRSWAIEGIPASLVCEGINRKAERHRAGRSTRPLRLEFCEADVRAVYDTWRHAVGMHTAAGTSPGPAESLTSARRPSLAKHLDRAIDRLTRAAGRVDLPEDFRDGLNVSLQRLVDLRETARQARGHAREVVVSDLASLDRSLVDAARRVVGDTELTRLAAEAGGDLAAYRTRLTPEAWQRSVDLGVDRLLRERLGLPTLTP